MYKLSYAHKELRGDIPNFSFKTDSELADYLDDILKTDDKETVYLLTFSTPVDIDDEGLYLPIIISQVPSEIYGGLMNEFPMVKKFGLTVVLHEWESFESAYGEALDMRECETNLCYDKPKKKCNNWYSYDKDINGHCANCGQTYNKH